MMLTDEELQILEQLTYLNNDVAKAAWIIREFTCEIYDAIMKVADKITTSTISVSDWSNYSGEDWYSLLLISSAVRAINAYF